MFPSRLQTILSRLEIKDETTKILRNRVRVFPGNTRDAQDFIVELEEERKIANCSRCEGEPFCPLFVACAYNALGRTNVVKSQIEEAIDCFQKHGMHWNEALATWLLGIFDKTDYPILANHELEKAIALFERISIELESKGEYNKLYTCRQLIDAIKEDIPIGNGQQGGGGGGPLPRPGNGGGGPGPIPGPDHGGGGSGSGSTSGRTGSSDENALFLRLLQMCKGDRNQVERLIHHEQTIFPHAGLKELIQRAIDRWIKDNR